MKKEMNVNISSGNVNIGNIIQGDHSNNKVESQHLESVSEAEFSRFFDYLTELENQTTATKGQIDELRNEINEIKTMLENKEEGQRIVDKVKEVYEKFSWAADAIKKLFSAISIFI